jgi:hypothetical protein
MEAVVDTFYLKNEQKKGRKDDIHVPRNWAINRGHDTALFVQSRGRAWRV